MEQLVGLGISWVWMGLEGKGCQYGKVRDIDTRFLVRELQDNGISVIASTIIGLEHHTPENIDEIIEWAVSHHADFHQFMLYMAPPGTPFYTQLQEQEALLDEFDMADLHGQYRFNYRHPHIKEGHETEFLLRAFERDFEVNGPSVIRMLDTLIKGWMRYKDHPEPRLRRRFALQMERMASLNAGAVWAANRWCKDKPELADKIMDLLNRIYQEFGMRSRIAAPVIGQMVLYAMQRENSRLKNQSSYEPPTLYQTAAKAVHPRQRGQRACLSSC